MPFYLILPLLIGGLALPAKAENQRHQATLMSDYQGVYQADFTAQFDRVRLLTQQAQLEISSRLGLIQYREGFQYPIVIRFQDGAPPGLENSLAYVSLMQVETQQNPAAATAVSPAGTRVFKQELVVNLAEMARHSMEFDTVFYHEMTHAVMNDVVGGEAVVRIPRWLQEGLAMYISGEGDGRVKAAAEKLKRSQTIQLLHPLYGMPTAKAYPQYYLAVKYILDRHTINALQALVRNLVQGRDFELALQDAMGLGSTEFQRQVHAYSKTTFEGIAIPDGFVDPSVQPAAIRSSPRKFSK
jgi:hypothetical protein